MKRAGPKHRIIRLLRDLRQLCLKPGLAGDPP